MSERLRVLLIEDKEADAELMLRHLRAGGYDPDAMRVDRREAVETALAEQSWELLLVDHSLPGFDSLVVLEMVKQRGLDVPFIIVSGVIGEEAAVDAMRTGAHDYIAKDNLARLLPAVRRELGDARERQRRRDAEAALRQQEMVFRSLIENGMDLIGILSGDGRIRYISPSIVKMMGYMPAEVVSRKASEFAHPHDAPALAACVAAAARRSRIGRYREIRLRHQNGSWRTLAVVANNLLSDDIVKGIVINGRDITPRKRTEERLRRSQERARRALEATIVALSLALEARDPYTAGHQHRVADLASGIARDIGLTEQQIETVRTAGFLHDVGKICVPAEILSKPGPLTDREMALVQSHPQVGHSIIAPLPFAGPVAEVILQHHERLDGSGYPAGLSGDSILVESRVLGVADVVEAMAAHRPYRPALGCDQTIAELMRGRGVLYDGRIVDACVNQLRQSRRGIGFA